MRLSAGTSGYSYKEWKGTFYPDGLPAAKMLSFYARHFGAVEINSTFYRMPNETTMTRWASEVPDGFTFVLKVPLWITHRKKLTGIEGDVRRLLGIAGNLGSKLGALRFLIPPDLHKDVPKLRELLAIVPRAVRVALDFRHESWEDEEVHAALRDHDAALCAADTDETPDPDRVIVPTASWGYVRLRRAEYSDQELAAWRRRVAAQDWSDACVFFKHEDEGKGPVFAKRFLAAAP